jgi:hypothetical protein
MRKLAALILWTAICSTSGAQAAPDLSPIGCAWDKLPAAEQSRLIDSFKVELKDKTFTLFYAQADVASATEAAHQCQLTVSPAQAEHLALALSRRGGEERAKKGIAERGESVDSVQKALAKVHEGKREVIGNRLGCPGPHVRVIDWDESIRNAIRKANLGFNNGRAYAFVTLALYAIMGQEGAMRRMAGGGESCS